MSREPISMRDNARRAAVTLKYDFSTTKGGLYVDFDHILTHRSVGFMSFARIGYVRSDVDSRLLVLLLRGLLEPLSGIEHVTVTRTSLVIYNDDTIDGAAAMRLLCDVLSYAGYRVEYIDDTRHNPVSK